MNPAVSVVGKEPVKLIQYGVEIADSLIFTFQVKTVRLYGFMLLKVPLHMIVKEFFKMVPY